MMAWGFDFRGFWHQRRETLKRNAVIYRVYSFTAVASIFLASSLDRKARLLRSQKSASEGAVAWPPELVTSAALTILEIAETQRSLGSELRSPEFFPNEATMKQPIPWVKVKHNSLRKMSKLCNLKNQRRPRVFSKRIRFK